MQAQAFKKLVNSAVLLVLIALLIGAVTNFQALEDWWRLRGYNPSPSIVQLADADTMTAQARHIFYVNRPELVSDKTEFRNKCNFSEQTIILGCYHSRENGIILYDVTDERLNGVEEVTAAHEMLHGAYDRLSSKDKDNINKFLEDYYNNELQDERVKATIDAYKKTEPNDVVNEMHSIFGTEISALPSSLENYYKRYFNNRQAVTSLSDQYAAVFSQNKQQLDSLKRQISQLKTELNGDKAVIDSEQDALLTESRRMQSLLSSGRTAEYNNAVGPYNARVAHLRSLISAYNSKINQVNSLVEQHNSLAYVQEDLFKSIDTRVQSQPVQ